MPKVSSRLEQRLKRFQSRPLVKPYAPRLCELSLPPPVWDLFYKLHDALEYCKKKNQEKRYYYVFSIEKIKSKSCDSNDDKGPSSFRQYVVSGLEEFWNYYFQLPADKRHFYEVIPENTPCHLFFDLEFETQSTNLHKDGRKLTEIWIQYVCLQLHEKFGVQCDASDVIQLESTSMHKFSHHLIFNLGSIAFKDVIHTGAFVLEICSDLKQFLSDKRKGNDLDYIAEWGVSNLEELLIVNSKGEVDLFVDLGVYNKNRNFRLLRSSKINKNIELKLSNLCSYRAIAGVHPCQVENLQLKRVFFESLVTNVDESCNLIEVASVVHCSKATIVYTHNMGSRAKIDTSLCPLSSEVMEKLQIETLAYLHKFNKFAVIRQFSFLMESSTVIFDIAGSRFCGNIEREHKSNNIMIVVNLRTKTLHQSCYDPDCRRADYRSSSVALSEDLCQLVDFELDDTDYSLLVANDDEQDLFEDSEVSDAELMKLTSDVVSTTEAEASSKRQLSQPTFYETSDIELMNALADDTSWDVSMGGTPQDFKVVPSESISQTYEVTDTDLMNAFADDDLNNNEVITLKSEHPAVSLSQSCELSDNDLLNEVNNIENLSH